MKKFLCILLTLAMLLACLPATAWAAETPKKAIIILPGTTGSELFTGSAENPELIWADASSIAGLLKILQVACDENGKPKYNTFPLEDDVSPYGTFYKQYTYDRLVDALRAKYDSRYGGNGQYEVRFLSYDWRLSNADSADRLHDFIEKNGYTNVVLIGHSMGGMVSVSYLAKYGYDKVDKLITLGTPYMGAPKALYALETGRYVDDPSTYSLVKPLAANVPTMYELLPTSAYLAKVGGYLYDGSLNNQLDADAYEKYLDESDWCNQKLRAGAEAFFTDNLGKYSLDTVYDDIAAGKVQAYIVVGSGCPTIGGYVMKDGEIDDVLVCDGDATLPLLSATMGGRTLARAPYCVRGVNHDGLVKNADTIQMLQNFIDGKGDTARYLDGCQNISVTRNPENEENNFYKITATGSVKLEIKDKNGTVQATVADGKITCTEKMTNVCHLAGNKKFFYVNTDSDTVTITGTGATDITVQMQRVANGGFDIVRNIGYDGVALTNGTQLLLNANADPANKLGIDKNGDGKAEEELSCKNFGSSQFRDVTVDDYFYDPVLWAVEEGVTTGLSDTAFGPSKACTRAQVVTFLWRAAGCPEPETASCAFTDVPDNAYYKKAVLWAVENGITTGTSKTAFSPNATVTRGQTVTFLYRFFHCEKVEKAADFVDVSPDAYYYDAVQWAYKEDITKGTTSTTFSPDNSCLRGQIVTFLFRCFVY